jgi:hypothetical protein
MPKLEFTKEEKNKIQILEQEIDLEKFDDKGLPADTHMVTYVIEGNTLNDAVRAYTMVDIFDAYYDKLKDTGTVVKIQSGYGNVRPNLYGKIKSDDND